MALPFFLIGGIFQHHQTLEENLTMIASPVPPRAPRFEQNLYVLSQYRTFSPNIGYFLLKITPSRELTTIPCPIQVLSVFAPQY